MNEVHTTWQFSIHKPFFSRNEVKYNENYGYFVYKKRLLVLALKINSDHPLQVEIALKMCVYLCINISLLIEMKIDSEM